MKKKPTVLAKQQRTQTKAWKQTSLSVPIDLLSNRQHYFRMRVAQPLEKSAKMLSVPLYGHASDQHAPPGTVSAPNTCLNGISFCIVGFFYHVKGEKTTHTQICITLVICCKACGLQVALCCPAAEKMSDLETRRMEEGGGRNHSLKKHR